jgi:hypothetical protein
MDQREDLILLVGANPLPNYVAVSLLRPKRVHLVFSPEVKDVMRQLSDCLSSPPLSIESKTYLITDATDVREIRRCAEDLPCGAALHYTGGTKTMAIHIHAVWQKEGGSDEWCSYLDDRGNRLRFDNGVDQTVDDASQINLDLLLKLHGLKGNPRSVFPEGPQKADAIAIAEAVIAEAVFTGSVTDSSLAAKLYETVPTKPAEFKGKPIRPDSFKIKTKHAEIPAPGWNAETVKAWARFLRGNWLEDWVAELCRNVLPPSRASVHTDLHATGNGRTFEADVLVIRGHKLYVISCTTATEVGLCKEKLYEVALRARQLGGDLTRFAFVCLLNKDGKNNDWPDILQNQVSSAWDVPNKPRVFGLKHLQSWMSDTRKEPDLSALSDWLTS